VKINLKFLNMYHYSNLPDTLTGYRSWVILIMFKEYKTLYFRRKFPRDYLLQGYREEKNPEAGER